MAITYTKTNEMGRVKRRVALKDGVEVESYLMDIAWEIHITDGTYSTGQIISHPCTFPHEKESKDFIEYSKMTEPPSNVVEKLTEMFTNAEQRERWATIIEGKYRAEDVHTTFPWSK